MSSRSLYVARALALGVMLSGAQFAQEAKAPAADNTKVNKRDRDKAEPTADRAKDNVNDRDIMQKIRQAVMDDKTLSTYAHNVKIVSQRGKVTLKGPVRSAEEKSAVAGKAAEVVGAGNVTDRMTIKAEKKKAS